ncbi:PREDICTED: small proline-rich protein 2H-like, partial [Eufriesea mexicana]
MNCSSRCKVQGTWNDMEEVKYLICAMECCQCPKIPPLPTCSIILPPRIEELPSVLPPQRSCCPPPRCPPTPRCPQLPPCPLSPPCRSPAPPCCQIPIVPNPCCISPPPRYPIPPEVSTRPCCPPSPLPCYP